MGLDVWQAKQLLARTQSFAQIASLAHDHVGNRFLELVQGANDATQQSSAAAVELKKGIEPKGITLATMRAASTRD